MTIKNEDGNPFSDETHVFGKAYRNIKGIYYPFARYNDKYWHCIKLNGSRNKPEDHRVLIITLKRAPELDMVTFQQAEIATMEKAVELVKNRPIGEKPEDTLNFRLRKLMLKQEIG